MGNTSLNLLEERVPPHNIEAEMALLGAMLLSEEARLLALEKVQTELFYKKANSHIFEAIRKLFENNQPCDLVTLTDYLNRQGNLKDLGGPAYLAGLIDLVPTPSNIGEYIKIVTDHFIRRSLIERCFQIISKSYQMTEDVDDLLDESEQNIFQISEGQKRGAAVPIKELVHRSFETLTRLYERRETLTGLPTGFDKLDEITSGFQNSDLIVLASRPSMGKTSLACSIARSLVVEKKVPVLIFSLEMSCDQLVQRLICSEARVNLRNLRSGFLREAEWTQLTMAAGKLSEAPLFIDDAAGLSALEIRARARRLVAREGIKIVFVDYLQLIRGRGRVENRQQEITEISASLKNLSKELSIPVVALSQLSREVEKRDSHQPRLSDLRESGSIEQDADVVLLLLREELYNPENPELAGLASLSVAKQRNGPTTGTPITLTFIKEYTRFENYSPRKAD